MIIRRAAKADRTDANGVVFDSKAEMRRYHELRLLERAGEISNLRRQVAYPLVVNGKPVLIRSDGYPNGRAAKYTADFVYDDPSGWPLETVEDSKGVYTDAGRLRIAVAEAVHGFRIKITGSADTPKRRRSGPLR